MGLEYGWTCGIIDDNIADFKKNLEHSLSDMLDECCPMLEGEQKTEFIEECVRNIYIDNEAIFEDLRKCNSDMRDAADKQIDSLESDKLDLQNDLETKQDVIDELEEKLEEYEN